jgi:hypothetical protein
MDQSNATRLRKCPEGVRKVGVWYVYSRSQEKKRRGPGKLTSAQSARVLRQVGIKAPTGSETERNRHRRRAHKESNVLLLLPKIKKVERKGRPSGQEVLEAAVTWPIIR